MANLNKLNPLPSDVQVILAIDLRMTDIIYVSHGFYGQDDIHTRLRKIESIEWSDKQLRVNPEVNEGEPRPLSKFFYPDSLVLIKVRW